MSDPDYTGYYPDLSDPGTRAAAVTPNDSADLAWPARYLFVGTAGNVVATTTGGDTVTIKSADSQYHPVQVRRVLATGTTAADIVAMA